MNLLPRSYFYEKSKKIVGDFNNADSGIFA